MGPDTSLDTTWGYRSGQRAGLDRETISRIDLLRTSTSSEAKIALRPKEGLPSTPDPIMYFHEIQKSANTASNERVFSHRGTSLRKTSIPVQPIGNHDPFRPVMNHPLISIVS